MNDNTIEIVNKDYIIEISQNSYEISAENVFSMDYNIASNIPSINNIKLTGNKSLSELGIQAAGEYADSNLANLSSAGENHFLYPSLSNLNVEGQAILDNKVNVDLSNLDATGLAIINGKADKATTLAGYGITDGANIYASNFHSQGRNLLAALSFPSINYQNLTLGASGTNYIAPDNGYIFVQVINSTNNPNYVQITNINTDITHQNQVYSGYGTITLLVAVSKNDTFVITYSNEIICQMFRFIYTKGAQ